MQKLTYRIYKRGAAYWFKFNEYANSTQGPFGSYEKAERMAQFVCNAPR